MYNCYNCDKCWKNKLNKDFKNRFAITFKFCEGDLNKLVLFLRKAVYFMDTWVVGINSMKLYYRS